VVAQLQAILNDRQTDLPPKGLMGSIEDNEFTMGIISADHTASFSATLKGKVVEKRNGISALEVYIMRSSSTYLTFFLSVIAAIIYFIMYFINPTSVEAILWGLGILIFGGLFSIWMSNQSSQRVQKQFEEFLVANQMIWSSYTGYQRT
jgi:hypothetical protein